LKVNSKSSLLKTLAVSTLEFAGRIFSAERLVGRILEISARVRILDLLARMPPMKRQPRGKKAGEDVEDVTHVEE